MERSPSASPGEPLVHLSQFRQLITLPDGARVCLRPLTVKDRDALVALFALLPADETRYFRSNVAEPEEVAGWAEHPDFTRVFPLVAVVGDRIVGNATLHLGRDTTRHIAEIRVFLAKDFRRHGIGSAMVKAQLEIARRLGIYQVIAEVAESRSQVIHAFERLGLERQLAWRDMFLTPQGELLDMVVLVNFLRRRTEDF